MKLFAAVLLLFLLSFAGLACGLFWRGRGLKGGCCGQGGHGAGECRCHPGEAGHAHGADERAP